METEFPFHQMEYFHQVECTWGFIYGTTFVSGVFHTCYLYLKKGELNKTKKTMLLQQNAILPLDSKRNM